ncbi:MAG: hypothetical protein JNL08_08775 [Planctomycetes bacterium]|nr:hypothetical protein [Planctomycetota bacterium]
MRKWLLSLWVGVLPVPHLGAQVRAELERLPPDAPAPTIVGLEALGEHRTVPAPRGGLPCGLASCRGQLWLLRGDDLLRIDPSTGAVTEALPADDWVALAADERFVFAATNEARIDVIDPLAGRTVRTIAPAAGLVAPICGLTVHDGAFLLADTDGRVLRRDGAQATATLFWRHPGWDRPSWICIDSGSLLFARGGLVHWIHARHGDVLRTAGGPETTLAATVHGGELWLLRSRSTGDEFFVTRPRMEVHSVDVRLIGVGGPGVSAPGTKPGDTTHWVVGRTRSDTGAELAAALRTARARNATTETVDGGRAAQPFVLQIHPGARVADVLATLDAAAAAGIELQTPGLAAWARAATAEAAAPTAPRPR